MNLGRWITSLRYTVAFLFLINSVSAQSFSETDIEKIKPKIGQHTSIQCNYQQSYELSMMNDIQTSNGKFFFAKGGYLRWEESVPKKQVLVFTPKGGFYLKNGTRKPFNSGDLRMSMVKKFIASVIDGSVLDSKRFDVESVADGQLRLTPKVSSLKKRFSSIELSFLADYSVLEVLTFNESGGDRRIITFDSHQFDQIQNMSIFE